MPMPDRSSRSLLAAVASLVVLATEPAGAASPRKPTPTPTPLGAVQVTITDPVPDLRVASDRFNIRGTFVAPANSGVTVNDVVAYQSNGRFVANDVPLVAGPNTIRVVATSPTGASASASVAVEAAGTPPLLSLNADVTVGIAPLSVTFGYDLRSSTTAEKIAIDFDGDGRDDFTSRKSAPAAVQNTYSQPGLYLARLTLTDSSRRVLTANLGIEVGSIEGQDALFLGVWNAMNDALVKQDVSRAAQSLNSRSAAQYAPVFQELLPDMPTIIASYSRPQRVSATRDVLEYAVNRTVGGVDQIFFIYLLRDADGVWRIDGL